MAGCLRRGVRSLGWVSYSWTRMACLPFSWLGCCPKRSRGQGRGHHAAKRVGRPLTARLSGGRRPSSCISLTPSPLRQDTLSKTRLPQADIGAQRSLRTDLDHLERTILRSRPPHDRQLQLRETRDDVPGGGSKREPVTNAIHTPPDRPHHCSVRSPRGSRPAGAPPPS